VEINILAFSYTADKNDKNEEEKKKFNEYAERNNIKNITINIEILKYEKPSDSYSYFKSLVESLLKKEKNPYDMFFYNSKYTSIYGPYLLNLNLNLPKEHIEMYNQRVLREECTYKNELVGLPLFMSYEVLYSNKKLLNKYNKSIPKTWDELIETCKYIMDKEKDDTELICYNGLFDESEQGLYSLYQFIYSCRDSYNSTYPNPQDP